MSYTSSSFYLDDDNAAYINEQIKDKKRYNKSNWLNDLVDHLRLQAENKPKPVKRSKSKSYPSNIEDQFNFLWDIKGKKGAKQKAYKKYREMMEGCTDELCEQATQVFMDDILKHKGEVGMPELHLTTYLNQSRWER